MNTDTKSISDAGANTVGHTPGPWEQCDSFGPCKDGTNVKAVADDYMICSLTGYYGRAGTLPNARLIAAAPELLAALRECADRLQTCAVAHGNDLEMAALAVQDYRDLIAKAEGRNG